MAECCALCEVRRATVEMLRHREWSWEDRAVEWAAAFAFLGPVTPCAGRGEAADGGLLYSASHSTLLLVTDQPKIGMVQLRQAHEACRGVGVHHLQLVSRHPVTTQTLHLNQSLPSDRHISILLWSLVLVYPLDHELVPHHRRATAAERARLAPVNQLPTLKADDPVAQYLGLRPGEVVHILRPDRTVYWRLIA